LADNENEKKVNEEPFTEKSTKTEEAADKTEETEKPAEVKEKSEATEEKEETSECKNEKKKFEKRTKEDKEKEELEKLKKEYADFKDSHLRVLAEYDNFRKRTAQEKSRIYNDAVSDTIIKLLPVADNIERARSQENATVEDLQKGFEMIAKQFDDTFEALEIKTIGKVGEKFDPEKHNAVSHVDNEELEENTVSQVFQKGYMIGSKVIRHAIVQVAN
jgi:molecular chaperone GrpE